jgi:hypothetical protein
MGAVSSSTELADLELTSPAAHESVTVVFIPFPVVFESEPSRHPRDSLPLCQRRHATNADVTGNEEPRDRACEERDQADSDPRGVGLRRRDIVSARAILARISSTTLESCSGLVLGAKSSYDVTRWGCDHDFQSEGLTVIRTPVRAPNANAEAERGVGSVRRECLDRLLIFSRRQLEHVLRVYTRHYNEHRPHRALALCPPEQADGNPVPLRAPSDRQLNRRGPARWPDPRIRTRCLSPNRFPISSQALLLGDLPPSVGSRARGYQIPGRRQTSSLRLSAEVIPG